MIVQKAFKYRFFPTDEQAAQLAKTFGCARYVYNQALEYRTTAWQQEKKSIGYNITAAKLTEWKKEPEKAFLSEVSSVVLQQSLRNLDVAFANFFEKRSQYPAFKSKHGRQSARYATNAFTYRDGQIMLAKQSQPLDIAWSRPPSKLCSSCGLLLDELPLSFREWDCPGCGAHHDRDENAAINILRAGQYLLKSLKTTGSDARKVTPTRHERRRSA
jgi:transposase